MTTGDDDDEGERLKLVALQNANSILMARHRAENELVQKLRKSEERTNYALGAARMAVWELDLVTRRLTWPETMAAMFDLTPDEAPTTPEAVLALIHPGDRAAVQESLARTTGDGSDLEVEFRVARTGGEARWLAVRGRVLRDAGGSPARLLGVAADVSDRRLLEAQLRQAQKLEAVGLLAGGIAHDFNNILSVILSYSDVLLLEVGPTSPWRADLEEIRKAGRRAADLTRQVLAFSRRQVMEPKILDLNEIIANAGKMLARILGEHIELKTRLAPDLGLVKADPGQIEQIIMNLVVNARDAMPQGGQLVIATSNVQVDAPLAAEHHGLTAGHHVMIAVSDTGVGMDKATQARVFEPFFTTKPTGKGTGLGLATVFGIVQQSRGAVWVDSEPNVGTTFRVYLPRSAGTPSWRPSAGVPREDVRGTETILLVEDEDQVRVVVSSILKNAGYRVLEAAGPGEAFAICEEHGAEIDLLLTDVVMPKLSGRQLAERIVSRHAGVKVLLMSGYSDDATLHDGILGAEVAFLHKPLTPSTLTRKVREVLDAP